MNSPSTSRYKQTSATSRTPLRVWVGLAIAVVLDVPVQLIWKALMIKYRDPNRGPKFQGSDHSISWMLQSHHHGLLLSFLWHTARWFFREVRTYVLLALFTCQFFDWIWVLGNADLSFAQPFTALSYVVVSTCAAIFFHEHLTPLRMIGIAAILIGVILVGSSEHKTTDIELPLMPERR